MHLARPDCRHSGHCQTPPGAQGSAFHPGCQRRKRSPGDGERARLPVKRYRDDNFRIVGGVMRRDTPPHGSPGFDMPKASRLQV